MIQLLKAEDFSGGRRCEKIISEGSRGTRSEDYLVNHARTVALSRFFSDQSRYAIMPVHILEIPVNSFYGQQKVLSREKKVQHVEEERYISTSLNVNATKAPRRLYNPHLERKFHLVDSAESRYFSTVSGM